MEIGGLNNQPIQSVLQYGGSETKGEFAQMSNIIGAIALSDMVKTTLGPKGMDKILINPSPTGSSTIEVTNDGATILKHLRPDNPAAKILIDISKTQDDEVGDGTTSVCVLSGELLREAEKLLQDNLHPQTIIDGYRMALNFAKEALLEASNDHKDDEAKFREDLLNIARTTISSKVLNHEKEHFAELAVNAVLRLDGSTNLDQIKIIKKAGGNMKDSYLDEGFILEKEIRTHGPRRIENAKILLADTGMDTDKIKIQGAVIRTSSMKTLSQIETAEKEKMKQKCENITNHNCNLFINRQLVYDYPMEMLNEKGVAVIEHADFEGIERLALVLGGDIVSTFSSPDTVTLGECDLVEEVIIGEDRLLKFSGCKKNQACTIVLRGASTHLLEEAERSLHDALCVLSQTVGNTRTVYGGGCSEMVMAKAIQERSKTIAGKKKLACEAFARALKQIPHIIAGNAGLDSADIVTALEAEHYKGNSTYGLDMNIGDIGDVAKLGILEAFKSKNAVITSATEAACMIVKIDSIVTTQPRQRRG